MKLFSLRRRFSRINRLSLRIASWSAGAVTLVTMVLVAVLRPGMAWLVALPIGLTALVSVYAAASVQLVRRLRLAHDTLLDIRGRRFENLPAARVPPGDELDALIRGVYRTGRALKREIEEFKKIENYRREYLGNVSHELKTPIFAIQGFTETLLDGAIEDEAVNRKFLTRILEHSLRLTTLTNDLTEISRIETGELKMTRSDFDLGALVGEVVESLEVQAEQSAITLVAALPERLPTVHADRDRIRQVLVNLIENGIKYNNPGGEVVVRSIPLPSGLVKVMVVDNGLGIERAHIPRLTERFYRVDRSRSRARGGTGLGLAIVKHILEAHGQRLTIESLPGVGSSFGFTLQSPGTSTRVTPLPAPKPSG